MQVNVDKLGTLASAICAVHCVLTGLALGLLSVLGLGFVGSGLTELLFVSLAVGLGVVAVVHGRRKHHSVVPAMAFVAGLTCISISHFVFGHNHGAAGTWHPGAVLFSVLGGLFLVAFHVLNLRMAKGCGCRHCVTGD